jgi:hypothetical protein
MKKSIILLVFLLPGIVLTSGCTSPQSPGPASPVAVLPASPSPVIPVTSYSSVTPLPGVTFRPGDQHSEITLLTEQTTRIQVDNPYLEYLQVRKKTFDYSIPNCPMQNAFPTLAKDPYYGIKQKIPNLAALSQDQYEEFLREYTEGKAENTPLKNIQGCQGADGTPEWNFVEIRVILNPTNVRPASYTISQVVRSNGEIIAQFTTTRTLVIDEKIALTSYIPLKTDELDLFDTVGITYTRQ